MTEENKENSGQEAPTTPGCGGCGGSCGGCHKHDDNVTWGESLARCAIEDMAKGDAANEDLGNRGISEEEALDRDIETFLKGCEESKADPIEVVRHIAQMFDLRISGGVPEGDGRRFVEEDRQKVYKFLREVVKRIALALFAHLADKYGFGIGELVQMVFGGASKGGVAPRTPANASARPSQRFVLIPVRFGYAVSW